MNQTQEDPIDINNDIIPTLKNLDAEESGKWGSWTLLIVTVILFFSAGIISLDYVEIMVLILVLFIHELGHMFAMKILKYNDIKMFFIPFLGAAVSGKSRNESALKSCIVSLMGPFPGLLMGIFLFFLYPLTRNYYVLKTAQISILLNAFNLLPIMPLDGGRYMDVLFVNNRYFRFVFALLGASAFLLLSFASEDVIIAIVGGLLIFGAFTNLKINTITKHLKREGIKAASLQELMGNMDAFEKTIRQLRLKFPKIFSPKIYHKVLYGHLNSIIDTLKFIPARFFTKIGLVVSYGIILLFSLFSVLFFNIALNYSEKLTVEETNGRKKFILSKYAFGSKRSQYTLNADYYFHGEAIGFYDDSPLDESPTTGIMDSRKQHLTNQPPDDINKSGSDNAPHPPQIQSVFFFNNGYREGEWLSYDKAGVLIERSRYEKGSLKSRALLEGNDWVRYTPETLSIFDKIVEAVKTASQPYKSNHQHFK